MVTLTSVYKVLTQNFRIMRITLTPAVFAVFNFLGVWNYRTTDYVTPIADIYEAFVFIAILYMLLAYGLPSSDRLHDQINFFTQHTKFSFRDIRRTYCYMVQFLPVTFCCVVINTIMMANTCLGGRGWRHAHLIIAIVGSVSTVLAVLGLFGIYLKLKADIKKVQPMILGQLFSFKVIVLLHFVQGLLLSILKATNTLKPTSTMSYNDLNLGLGPFLTCCEALIIVCGMCYFYNPNMHGKNSECVRASNGSPDNDDTALEDGSKRSISKPKLGPVKAIWDVINVSDVFVGMRNSLWLLSHKSVVA